jgi:hypothetical protein
MVCRKISKINSTYFSGNQVFLREDDVSILVNLDYFQASQNTYVVTQPMNPVYSPMASPATITYQNNGQPLPIAAVYVAEKQQPVVPAVIVSQQPPQPRTMNVRVPPDCPAGAVLTVAAPDGTQVQVLYAVLQYCNIAVLPFYFIF